ncbi:MAG: hypothetical protein HY647_03900 [Acidobacteria bacterium]|nr:hypothetical protein [Acidobacteriota bacterium]
MQRTTVVLDTAAAPKRRKLTSIFVKKFPSPIAQYRFSAIFSIPLAFALSCLNLFAQDSNPRLLWTPGGVKISSALGQPVAITDGAGGAIFSWSDLDVSNPGVVAQRLSNQGAILWQVNGVTLADIVGRDKPPIVSDRKGGAVVAWQDWRTAQEFIGQYNIYAQRVNSSGNPQWQVKGVPISTACWFGAICNNQKYNPQAVSDGAGGAIITWWEMRDGFNLSVWAQRVRADGIPAWAKDGVPVAYGLPGVYAEFPKLVSDGAGGAIIAWQDSRTWPTIGIFAQHLDGRGIPQWPVNGIELAPDTEVGLGGYDIISDGRGGAIVTWADSDIYAQRVSADGQLLWQSGGVPICLNPGPQHSPTLTTDGAHGAIIVWEDQSFPSPSSAQRILAQRVSALGVPQWTTNGIPIYTLQGYEPHIVSDARGGAIIVWGTSPVSNGTAYGAAIYIQRVNGSGQIQWPANGFEVYLRPNGIYAPLPANLISDGAGGAIVYWSDDRSTLGRFEMYAQRIS